LHDTRLTQHEPDQNWCKLFLHKYVIDGYAGLTGARRPFRANYAVYSNLQAENEWDQVHFSSLQTGHRSKTKIKRRQVLTWSSLLLSSQSTMQGHFEPSSSATGVKCFAAFVMMMRPTRAPPERQVANNIFIIIRRNARSVYVLLASE
jgi:hypothetical protein